MDARWWRNEAINMHVPKLSMGLEKLKFHFNHWVEQLKIIFNIPEQELKTQQPQLAGDSRGVGTSFISAG